MSERSRFIINSYKGKGEQGDITAYMLEKYGWGYDKFGTYIDLRRKPKALVSVSENLGPITEEERIKMTERQIDEENENWRDLN